MAVQKKEETIELKEIKIERFPLRIVGDSPLLVHAWSEKAIKKMLDTQTKKGAVGKAEKNPFDDFVCSLYWVKRPPIKITGEEAFEEAVKQGAVFGFPSIALKSAAASAGFRAKVVKDKVSTYGAFHIDEELMSLVGTPSMRQDMVTVANGSADIRFRGEFREWSSDVIIKYNSSVISPEIVVNLINLAGFSVGIGEWRVEKGGRHGMFHVEAA